MTKRSRHRHGQDPPDIAMQKSIERVLKAAEDPTIQLQQQRYAQAVLERGDLPPEIMAKYRLMQKLYAKLKAAKKFDEKAWRKVTDIASELAPYFNFRVDDMPRGKQ